MTQLPQSREEAKAFATALREFHLGENAAVDGDCIGAVCLGTMISDEIETWFGSLDGAGHHVIVANGWLIDVTADQFGSHRKEVVVVPMDEIAWSDYAGFRPHPNFRDAHRCGGENPMENFWSLLSEFEGSDRMIAALV